MPVHFPEKAGKPFRPSNGTEGDMFMARFCDQCTKDDGDTLLCLIIAHSMACDINEKDYPAEWIYDVNGRPTCTAFASVDAPERFVDVATLPLPFEDQP